MTPATRAALHTALAALHAERAQMTKPYPLTGTVEQGRWRDSQRRAEALDVQIRQVTEWLKGTT